MKTPERHLKQIYENTSILLVDDESNILLALETTLLSAGVKSIYTLNEPDKIIPFLEQNDVHLLFLDENMGQAHGSELIEPITLQFPNIQIIMLTAVADLAFIAKCLKKGATDFLTKPVDEIRLLTAIINASKKITMLGEMQRMKSYLTGQKLINPHHFTEILTCDEHMFGIFKYIESVSKTPLPILLAGETGVGKELFAHAIHLSSETKGSFIAFNAAGIDDNLFSDTLFGHTEGAYTGAESKREGLLAQAQNGTLFIDEIGDLPLNSQVKLLRLLQEKEYYPLGSDKAQTSNTKIVCATNQKLEDKIVAGTFRSDLYYRLSSHIISIPNLADRIQDLEILLPHFLNKYQPPNKPSLTYPKQLLPLLSNYRFPGNIRELEMMVANAVAVAQGNTIPLEPFFKKIEGQKSLNKEQKKEWEDDNSIENFPSLKDNEKEHILKALKLAQENQSLAARLLGITRQTLAKKLKE